MPFSDYQADGSRITSARDIDLRAEMSRIMANHGFWGILRKHVAGRRCQCTSSSTHEADPDCRLCLGTGQAFVDHPVRLRRVTVFGSTEQPMPVGRMDSTLFKFYLQYHVRPDRGDFLLEIAQDEQSLVSSFQIQPNIPLTVVRRYDVQHVDDMREAGGRMEFFTVWAELADLGDAS